MNDKLRISVGEACKLVLVQIHDEEFVGGREFHGLPRELLIEVGSVVLVFLLDEKAKELKAVRGKAQGGAPSKRGHITQVLGKGEGVPLPSPG